MCYEIYNLAKKKAKLAKKDALNAYLELQKLKEQYNLELSDSEEESGEEFDNSKNFEESDEESEFSDNDNNEIISVTSTSTDVSNISDLNDYEHSIKNI